MSITISEPTLTLAQSRATASGFKSVSEYVESLIQDDSFPQESDEEFRIGLLRSIADMKAGRGRPAEEVLDELAREFDIPWPPNQ